MKKMFLFELILGECQLDPDPVFKIMICWIRIRPKMDRIRNPDGTRTFQLYYLNGAFGSIINV